MSVFVPENYGLVTPNSNRNRDLKDNESKDDGTFKYIAIGVALIFVFGFVSFWYTRRKMQKRLKDPTYLPSYGETIHLRGRHAPVRVDVELTELPPPSYDAESTRALDEHVPIWLIEERGENCGLVGVRVVREGEEQEQGGSGSGSSATRVVSAAEIMEGDREVEGREEEERDEMPSVGPSVMEMTNGAELDETMTDDNQSNIPPTLPTVVIRNEEDEIASAHSHMEDDLHDTQLPSISSSSSPGSMEREGTPDQWGPPPSYS